MQAGRAISPTTRQLPNGPDMPVEIVAGSPDNVKLTWARDIAMADRTASQRSKLSRTSAPAMATMSMPSSPGDHVTLCGVAIPHDKKLSGHSDADVGLHALTDALLATCGAGDIGTHFPPSDPQWKGAASRIFVEHAAGIVRAQRRPDRQCRHHVDLRGAENRAASRGNGRRRLRPCSALPPNRISIKATTNEKLGFIGREEGIAAIATASVDLSRGACRNERARRTRADRCWPPASNAASCWRPPKSCTGGMIAAALTDIAGSSTVVDRGFVTYSNEAKMEMLGVRPRRWMPMARSRAKRRWRWPPARLRHSRAGIAVVGYRHCRSGRRFG